MAIFGALILSVFRFAGCFALWASARDVVALDTGHYRHLAGPITAMVKQPWKGRASELASVQGRRFLYLGVTAASDGNRITDPGCLYAGLPARIAYTGNHVLRMAIAMPPGAPPACDAELGEAPDF